MTAATGVGHGSLLATGALTLSASIVGAAVNFGIAVVVGRSYGAADTGVFFALVGVFLVLTSALRCGADTGLTRSMSRLQALDRSGDLRATATVAIVPVVVLGVLVTAAMWVFGDTLAIAIGAPGGLGEDLVHVLTPFALVLALTTLLNAGTRGLGRVAPYALLQNVALPVTRLIGVAAAAALGLGITGATLGWAVGLPLVALASAAAFLATLNRTETRGDRRSTRWRPLALEFWSFSLPRALSSLVEIALEWLDVILVALLAGQAAAGVYAVATRLVKVALMVDQAVRVSVSTRISAWLAVGEVRRVQDLYEIGTAAMIGLVWPFLIILATFPDAAMGVFGQEFRQYAPILMVQCAAMALLAAAGSLQSILLLGGMSSRQLVNKSLALATCVLLNVLLTPGLGALGGALSWAATVVVDTTLVAWAVKGRIGIRISARGAMTSGPLVLAAVAPIALLARWVFGGTVTGLLVAALGSAAMLLVMVRRSRQMAIVLRRMRAAG